MMKNESVMEVFSYVSEICLKMKRIEGQQQQKITKLCYQDSCGIWDFQVVSGHYIVPDQLHAMCCIFRLHHWGLNIWP